MKKEWLVSLYFQDKCEDGEPLATREQVVKAFNNAVGKLTVKLPSDLGGTLTLVDCNDAEEYKP